MELADMSNLKFDGESREGATPSIPTNHPKYKEPIWKIYGPYQRIKDLRRHVIAYDGQKRITISYPRFLLECKLQRELLDNEEAHHINQIEFDDRIENLEVRNSTEHRKYHSKPGMAFICPVCKNVFEVEGLKLSRLKSERKRKPNMKGPYCSRHCSGKENN